MIDIVLVEDHNIVLNGIKSLLNKEQDIRVMGSARDGIELLALLEGGLQPHLLIMDINMPEMDGLTVAQKVSEIYPEIDVLILTMYDQTAYVNQAFRNGAKGYLLKNANPEELPFAIRQIAGRKERYICSELALSMLDRQLLAADVTVPDNTEYNFSQREIEILNMVSEGYTNQEIADRLYTSKRTVEGHRQNLIEKTGARNFFALIRFAIKSGLLR
jgi:DNA-binding NarL/FixJ family response regulator